MISKIIRKSRSSLVAALLLSTALTAFGTMPTAEAAPTPESERIYSRAKDLEKSGDIAGAIIQLKNAIRIDPDLTQGRYELGLLYLRTADPAAAQSELESARSRGYDETKIIGPLVQAYLAQSKFREILRNIDPAKFSGDTQSELMAVQGRAHIALQDLAAARGLIEKALAQSPALPSVLATAATLARVEQRYPDAEKYTDQGLAAAPDNVELLVMKAEARQQVKDFDGALKALDHAVSKQPRYPRARLARGLVNLARGKPDLLPDDVREVLAVDPKNPIGLYLRAVIVSNDRNYREATQILLGLPELLDGYPPARYLLAAAAFSDNQFESARSNAELYLKKVPGDVAGSNLLAAAALRLNDPKRAVEILEPLAKANGDNNQLRVQLASAYLGVGRSEEAVKLFEQGVQAEPENDQTRMALAVSQLQTGAVDAGVLQLQKLIEAKPDSLRANQLLILAHLQGKQFDKAVATADAMIKASPKSAEAHNLKGTVSLAKDDLNGARTAFNAALANDAKFTPAMLNLARIEERSTQLDAARSWYQKVIAVDRANQTAYSGLTNLALAEKKTDEAVKFLEQAISVSKTDVGPRLRLVDVLLGANQPGRALIAARDFANALPNDAQAVDALGRTQVANGEVATALGTYRRLVTMSPDNAEAQRRLGRALVTAADVAKKQSTGGGSQQLPPIDRLISEAKATFDAAIADAPDYPAAVTDRIALEKNTDGDAAALKLAQKLVQDRPESVARLIASGDLAAVIGNNQVALVSYQTAWNKAKSGPVVRRLYDAMAKDKKAPEALQMLKKWTTENPTDFESRFLIASIAIAEGRNDDAIAETEAMDGALPDNPIFLNNLAWLYGEKNSPKAFEIGQKALELAPESPDVLDTLGWLEVEKRDLKKGVALLEKSHKLATGNPVIAYHYAAALKRSGDAVKAKAILQESLKIKGTYKERAMAEALLKEIGG